MNTSSRVKINFSSQQITAWPSLIEVMVSMSAQGGELRNSSVGSVQIDSLEREDGSGVRFNFKGFCEGRGRFEAFFDYKLNQGNIKFS